MQRMTWGFHVLTDRGEDGPVVIIRETELNENGENEQVMVSADALPLLIEWLKEAHAEQEKPHD